MNDGSSTATLCNLLGQTCARLEEYLQLPRVGTSSASAVTAWREMERMLDSVEHAMVTLRTHLHQQEVAMDPEQCQEYKTLQQGFMKQHRQAAHLLKHGPGLVASTTMQPVAPLGLVDATARHGNQPATTSTTTTTTTTTNNNNNNNPAKNHSHAKLQPLTPAEMDTIPKYMLNRLTLDKLNHSIEELNKILQDRYKLLRMPTAKMSKVLRQRYWSLKQAENTDTSGRTFFTDEDVQAAAKTSKFRIDPNGRAVLAILRHLRRLKESRGGGRTRYILL